MQNLKLDWIRTEAYPKLNGLKVFGTFVCGGGSTMGYKLEGFSHLGGVEIDKKMANLYRLNHDPKYLYTEDIRDFNKRNDLPSELYNLDILDGSPPCSTFSMSGNREKDWGKERVFKEGQNKQTLDDLVFVYCETIEKLKPKVAILENVSGILAGNAKGYAIGIVEKLNFSGYDVQIFKLNSATMGVAQARERVFFIARRQDLSLPSLKLNFNEKPITFKYVVEKNARSQKDLWPSVKVRLPFLLKGEESLKFADARYRGLSTYNAFFSTRVIYDQEVAPTLTSSGTTVYYNEMRGLSNTELRRMQSFPKDYNFSDLDVRYVCGMSVPPVMISKIVKEMKFQWFGLSK